MNEFNVEIQSAENMKAPPTGESSNLQESEVVRFDDDDQQSINFAAIYDDVTSDLYTPNYELGDFLSRPTKLYHYTITPGAPFADQVEQVWTDFFGNPVIQRKLHNFSYIQCKLKLKVVVNSTPFIYGFFGMTYAPLVGLNRINDGGYGITRSQRPTVWIDLSKSEGGEMELPFFYYKNWLPINLASTTDGMGEITTWQMAQAEIANAGVTSTPSVTIYAWAEDVRLYGNTINLAIQSGENDSGPISRVASTVAKGASYFESIPIIGRFAKALNIGAGAVAGIASIFGFTNVPVVENAAPYKSMPFHGLASAHISNVVDKLTIDPENELAISPETVGLPPTDELAIANIVARDAILSVPYWYTTDSVDQIIWSAYVNPGHCILDTGTPNQTIMYETPLAMASRMFSSWRGDIIYTFRIIKTPYHKGRLIITYDPTGDIIGATPNSNTVQSVIVDITETDHFTVRVPYMAPQSFLICDQLATPGMSDRGTPPDPYNSDYYNGRLVVRVLNNLTAPLDTAAVRLVVFVRGAENFELANPTDIKFTNNGGYGPHQWVIQSEETELSNYVMGKSRPTPEALYDVNMGERVASLRCILRRSTFINSELINDGTAGLGLALYNFVHTKYPQAPGYSDTSGIHGAYDINGVIIDRLYNFVAPSPFYYISSCFVGMRGSTIWHYNGIESEPMSKMQVRRQYDNVNAGTAVTTRADIRKFVNNVGGTGSSYSNCARNSKTYTTSGLGGLSLVNQRTQTGLSVLYPQYNKFRFVSADPGTFTYGTEEDDTLNEKFVLELVINNLTSSFSMYDRYFSIGPDFNFFYFLNVPPRYLHNEPNPASF